MRYELNRLCGLSLFADPGPADPKFTERVRAAIPKPPTAEGDDEALATAVRAHAVAQAELGDLLARRRALIAAGDAKGLAAHDVDVEAAKARVNETHSVVQAAREIAAARQANFLAERETIEGAALAEVRRVAREERESVEKSIAKALASLSARWSSAARLEAVSIVAGLAGVRSWVWECDRG